MSSVSLITVKWTPEDGLRVAAVQIQSRIVGQDGWTEQAVGTDPKAGIARFQSDAPSSQIEVRIRYRMTTGAFGEWLYDTVTSADALVDYGELLNPPKKLQDINAVEGNKLANVQNGATKGAPTGTLVGDVPAENVVKRVIDVEKLTADGRKLIDDVNNVAFPARDAQIKQAQDSVGAAQIDIGNLKTGAAQTNKRIDELVLASDGDDGVLSAEIKRVETLAIDGDKVLAQRIDVVSATQTSGGGNLLSNTDFPTMDGWEIVENLVGAALTINTSGDWQAGKENALTLQQLNRNANDTFYVGIRSPSFAVTAGQWIQYYAFTASHRSRNWVSVAFFDNAGLEIAFAGEGLAPHFDNGGRDIGGWDQVGNKSYKVPVGATSAKLWLRKYNTFTGHNESIAWFMRPYVGIAREGQTSWNPYSVGGAKAVQIATDARVKVTTDALATQTGSLASRATALEATSNMGDGNSINTNVRFNAWPADQELPTNWRWWNKNGTHERGASESNGTGTNSIILNAVAGYEHGLNTSRGLYLAAGWYVLEAEVFLASGTYVGSGITLGGQYSINFSGDPDINNVVSATGPARRKFSKLMKLPELADYNFHPMANWTGFATNAAALPAKKIYFNRVSVRAATDMEIATKGVIDTTLPQLTARVRTTEDAVTDGRFATAIRATALEAQSGNDSNNLVRNGIFNQPDKDWALGGGGKLPLQWGSWNQDGAAYIGPYNGRSNYGAAYPLQIDRNGVNNGITQSLGPQAAGWYVIEADVYIEDGVWTGAGFHLNAGNGSIVHYHFAVEADTNGEIIAGNVPRNRKFSMLFNNATVSPNFQFYLMAGWSGFATNQGFARTVWHRAVVRPATDGEIKAQKANATLIPGLSARIGVVETATTNGTFATASRVGSLEAKVTAAQTTWRVRSAGNGSGKSAGVVGPDGTVYGTYARSYTVVVFQANANVVESIRAFDVYGNGQVQYNPGGGTANNAAGMAAWLNGITNGKTVVIYTADEPNALRHADGLLAAMYRCGAGDVYYREFFTHSAYALVGRAGVGKGGGQEYYVAPAPSSADNWLEVPFELIDGKATVGTGRGLTSASARIDSVETTITNGTFATAQRANSLEAAIAASNGSSLVSNTNFSVWPEGQELPTGWIWWAKNGTYIRNPSPASSGGFTWRHNVPANIEAGIFQNATRAQPGYYVFEADIELLDGNLGGAGLTISGVVSLDFARDPDTNGLISGGGFYRRRFTKLVYLDRYADNWHVMTNWSGLAPMQYKYMDWYYAGIRPATDGEVKAQKADDALNKAGGVLARISTVETVTTNGTFASASRANALEAQMNGEAGSRLLSRAEGTASVLASNALGAANSRMDVMVSEYNGIGSKVTQQAGTIADVNYRTRAYIVSTAVAGGNRAQLAIYADSNNGAGVDIVGDVRIGGNLVVDGTISSSKMAVSAVQQVAFVTLGYDIAVPRGAYGGGGYGGGGGGGGGGGTQIQ